MARGSYLQRLTVGRPADGANVLTPIRQLFPPRSALPESAFPALHEMSSEMAETPPRANAMARAEIRMPVSQASAADVAPDAAAV